MYMHTKSIIRQFLFTFTQENLCKVSNPYISCNVKKKHNEILQVKDNVCILFL